MDRCLPCVLFYFYLATTMDRDLWTGTPFYIGLRCRAFNLQAMADSLDSLLFHIPPVAMGQTNLEPASREHGGVLPVFLSFV